jgi:hypothetical protein
MASHAAGKWGYQLTDRTDPARVYELARGKHAEGPDDPDGGRATKISLRDGWINYRRVGLNEDGTLRRIVLAEPMPPTSCSSIEAAPKGTNTLSGAHNVHSLTVSMFKLESGFGVGRMLLPLRWNDRGILVSSPSIDRVELVSLLVNPEPVTYVLEEMATPAITRQAKLRPLDEFERLGLDAVRRGQDLVWTREAPMRMFGAIRAETSCLACHDKHKEGDLLGAFTYYLNTPADRLSAER